MSGGRVFFVVQDDVPSSKIAMFDSQKEEADMDG